MENESATAKSSGKKTLPIIIAVIVVLLLVAGGYYYHKHAKKTAVQGAMTETTTTQSTHMPMPSGMQMKGHMNMQPQTPPALSNLQQQQLASGTATTTIAKTFNVTGGNFYFTPNKITVNQGDRVTIIFTNAGGFHDFVIDEFNVKTPVIQTGKTATVTFTASKKGTFDFYCSVPNHRQMGMQGTLIVQ